MKPSKLSATLRQIATRIDNSEKPSKTLVARELRKVVASIDPKIYVFRLDEEHWATSEFNENVSTVIKEEHPGSLSHDEISELMESMDSSLWMDGTGDEVAWYEAGDPAGIAALDDMEITNESNFGPKVYY